MATRTWTGTTSGDWNVTTNWLEGVVPVTGDDVYFANVSTNVTLNLNQSAMTLNSLNVSMSYTGQIGVDAGTAAASTALQIGATTVNLCTPSPNGSPTGSNLINLNLGSGGSVVNIFNSNQSSAVATKPPIRLTGTGLTINASGGNFGVAVDNGQTATITALNVASGAPTIYLGPGVTLTAALIETGAINNYSGNTCPSVYITGGSYNAYGSAAHTTLSAYSGAAVAYNSSGTITTLNFGVGIDFSGDARTKTITNANAYPGGSITDPLNIVTFTNPITRKNGAKAVYQ